MKLKLILLCAASLFVGGLRDTFTTANAGASDAPPADDIGARVSALEKSLADKNAQIADLQKQLGAASAPKPEGESALDLMIKGAKLDPKNVKWRVTAGLTPEQAIDAARSQAVYEKAKEKAEKQSADQKAAADKSGAKK